MSIRQWRMRQVVVSFPQVQGFEDLPIGGLVVLFEIFEEAAAAADHSQQALARTVIALMGFEMPGEPVDAVRQKRHLHLRRAGVFLVLPDSLQQLGGIDISGHVGGPAVYDGPAETSSAPEGWRCPNLIDYADFLLIPQIDPPPF